MYDVVVLGSANLDLVVRAERHPRSGETLLGRDYREFPGGKGLNQAVAASRAGASVAFVGAVGDDSAGTRLLDEAGAAGVDIAHVKVVPGVPTGRALITVADDGDNTIVVVPGANLHVPAGLPPGRVLLAQLEIPLPTVVAGFASARADGARTLLNPAPAILLPAELVSTTEVIIPNQHEADLLGGEDALVAAGVRTVVTTMGEEGAAVVRPDETGGGTRRRYPAPRVVPVDTTGAGDAFCGVLAARLASGAGFDDAMRWALAGGSLATTTAGAVPSLPTAAAIEAFLSGAG